MIAFGCIVQSFREKGTKIRINQLCIYIVVAQDLKNRREDLTIQPKAIIYYVKISQRKFRKQSQVQVNRSC